MLCFSPTMMDKEQDKDQIYVYIIYIYICVYYICIYLLNKHYQKQSEGKWWYVLYIIYLI